MPGRCLRGLSRRGSELKREKLTLATQNFLDAGMGNVSDAFAYFELRGVSREDLARVRVEDLNLVTATDSF